MKSPEEIVELYEQRQRYYGKDINRMRNIQRLMNNEMDVPLPELKADERSIVANLALRGQEQLSQRIASVDPVHYWPSTHPGYDAPDQRAVNRHRVVMGWHEENDQFRIRSKRARHFLSWATSPVVILPSTKTRRPKWEVKRPLETFLPPGSYDDLLPRDIITCDIYSYQDLLKLFDRDAIYGVTKPPNWNWDNDINNYGIEFEVLTYIDDSEISMHLVGHAMDPTYHRQQHSLRGAIRLTYAPNLVGRPLVVSPGRICLDEQLGHYDGIIGMYQAQSALMSLLVIGQRKAVWPREWVESLPNSSEEPEITQDPDPYLGIPGIISNGRMNQQNLDPSFKALEILDRQEESIRKDAGIPAEMSGVSRTHISALRGAQVMSSTIDFTISEAQRIFARSIKEENKLAIAIDKAYFNTKKTFFIETPSYVGAVTYTPEDLWETDTHIVQYPIAGTDIQNLPIEGGQRVQMETLSRFGFMEVDPLVRDPQAELQRIDRESIKRAFVASLLQQVANPDPNANIQATDLALLDQKLASGTEMMKAWIEVDNMIKERQAQMAQQQQLPPGPEGVPPEMMGGTATPGTRGQIPAPGPIPQPSQDMARFTQLLGSLGTAQTAQRFRGAA